METMCSHTLLSAGGGGGLTSDGQAGGWPCPVPSSAALNGTETSLEKEPFKRLEKKYNTTGPESRVSSKMQT